MAGFSLPGDDQIPEDCPPITVDIPDLEVTVSDISIEELDVTASGMTSVERCTVDGAPVTVLISLDENHPGGQGVTSDDGVFVAMVVGWVDDAGAVQPAATIPTLVPCDDCDIDLCDVVDECGAGGLETPIVSVFADGHESPNNATTGVSPVGNQPWAGVGTGGPSAAFGPPDGVYAITASDGTAGSSGGVNNGYFTFDVSALPECEPVDVTLIVHATAVDDTGAVVGDGNANIDGLAVSLAAGNVPVPPTTIVSGGLTPHPTMAALSGGVGDSLSYDTGDLVGNVGRIEAIYALTAADIAAGITLAYATDDDGAHANHLAIDAIELVVQYDPADPCVATAVPAVRVQVCDTVDVNITNDPLEVVVVEPDPEIECETEYLLGCDDVNGDGSLIVQYLIPLLTCTLSGAVVSQEQLDPTLPDFTPYTPVNPVVCDPATLDFDEELFCDAGTGVTFIRRTVVLAGTGVIVENVELDGVTPYTPVGPIEAGACTVETPDPGVEPCGTVCRITFDGRAINVAGGFVGVDGVPFPGGPVNGGNALVDSLADIGISASYDGFINSDVQQVSVYSSVVAFDLGNGGQVFAACENRQALLVKLCESLFIEEEWPCPT